MVTDLRGMLGAGRQPEAGHKRIHAFVDSMTQHKRARSVQCFA
jgi:hypothetical protein